MHGTEKIALATHIREMDRIAPEILGISSQRLMYNAAFAFYKTLIADTIFQNVHSILILCGRGNNGGDGYVIAKLLQELNLEVFIYSIENEKPKSADCQYFFELCKNEEKIHFIKHLEELDSILLSIDLLIDAVYGTGFYGSFKSEAEELFKKISTYEIKSVAVDIPSGVHADKASLCLFAFKADLTITFEFLKLGLVSYPAFANVGRVEVVSIGFTPEIREEYNTTFFKHHLIKSDPLEIEQRKDDSHKGNFGKLLMLCGSSTMTGAGYFAAMGALRTGIGLLYYACPKSIMTLMQTKLNEPLFLPYEDGDFSSFIHATHTLDIYSAILFGSGSGQSELSEKIHDYLLTKAKQVCIFDADAISILSRKLFLLKEKTCPLVLTPHPAEMARLIQRDTAYVQANRLEVAQEFSQKYQCYIILKGARTVIALPDGEVYINTSGNPGMGCGGSGDVLAGMVASLAGQGYPLAKALCSAVYSHGYAGDKCKEKWGERAMLPSDIINEIR